MKDTPALEKGEMAASDKGLDISIIIVNWNTKDLLLGCLQSIFKTIQGITYEIIVVDNGSRDGSAALLRQSNPQIQLMENAENRGFAAANNQAMGVMAGRYALLLNTDTVLTENAAGKLFSFMESHPEAAMACGQLLHGDGRKQNSIAAFPSLLTLMFNMSLLESLFPRLFPSKRYTYHDPVEIDSGVGACLLVRKKAIDEVGMFDERYFFFFEETDWAFRMRRAGWKIFHVPSAEIFHFQGQSIGTDVRSRIHFYRSRYQFFRKWNSLPYYCLVCGVIVARLLFNWLLTSVACALTMGLNSSLRDKWIVYSRLILWHAQGCP